MDDPYHVTQKMAVHHIHYGDSGGCLIYFIYRKECCFCYRSNNVWFWKEQGLVSFAEMKCQKCKYFGAHNTPLPLYNMRRRDESEVGTGMSSFAVCLLNFFRVRR